MKYQIFEYCPLVMPSNAVFQNFKYQILKYIKNGVFRLEKNHIKQKRTICPYYSFICVLARFLLCSNRFICLLLRYLKIGVFLALCLSARFVCAEIRHNPPPLCFWDRPRLPHLEFFFKIFSPRIFFIFYFSLGYLKL